jgi:hypothetical protein
MSIARFLDGLLRRFTTAGHIACSRARRKQRAARRRLVPRLEVLEDRTLPSGVSFSPAVTYGVGASAVAGPQSVAVADFNGDGKADLAVANYYDNSVSLLLGNGDGTFRPAQTFFAGRAPLSVAVGDFNGDGRPDLVLVTPSGVNVLLNNGDGTFRERSYPAGSNPESVAVGDFNGDGRPDLAVANFISNNVSILIGNSDGTFQAPLNFAVGNRPQQILTADFNGDGRPDLAVANANNISILLGNGDGTFQAPLNFAPGAQWMAAGDFNGDGRPDLAVLPSFFSSNVSILLGNGDGTFQPAQNFATGTDLTNVAVADFNGDGKPDLAVVNSSGAFGNPGVSVLVGNGDGSFQAAQFFPTRFPPTEEAVGDFNGDGRPDLVVTEPGQNLVGVFLNQFATTTTVSGPANSTYAQSVTYAATITSGGVPVTNGAVTFLDGTTPISSALPLDANGQASFSTALLTGGSHTIVASYSGTPDGAGVTGFGASAGSTGLTVVPLTLSASAVNFGATAGAPFTGAVATFTNPDPFGGAASYTATIAWGDGSTSTGAITGTGTLTVSGSHTYADPNSYSLTVQISHNLGDTTTATVYPTATVTSLGQSVQDGLTGGIGFWHSKNGQALINAFNGGPDSTALSSWLATAFPNLYGSLSGASNTGIAAFYQSQFALPGTNLAAEVLATALNVYATTQSLGGTVGQAYGFNVTAIGLGADSFNVRSDGAAFGVANNTTRNVYELLKVVDQQSAFGSLYNGDTTLQKEANDVFDALNKAGAI